MPKRTDIETILIVGAGPIVIGQGCEFDYSGTQACTALKNEGYRIVLVNANPATIMTDPEFADKTYIEPLRWQSLSDVIAIEKPDAILPTMGGQTALNVSLDLASEGVLDAHGVTMLGVDKNTIEMAEDREKFRAAMQSIGLSMPESAIAHDLPQACDILEQFGFPIIIRPSFTLGGSGGGIAYNREEFETICQQGLALSPTHELQLDRSIIGWKEFELELLRDKIAQSIVVCSIENVDPMGIHTGDSITVAPAQTLADKEYQLMRNDAISVLAKVGVAGGGANVQFGVNPKTGERVVIEMNPRVSRSSALASKATGYPIASVAARLAVGYHLDELNNVLTQGKTPAFFEPSIDYVVTKVPRFTFEKFPESGQQLTTQMRSVGEVMAMAPTFSASLQKALASLEIGVSGLDAPDNVENLSDSALQQRCQATGWDRLWFIAEAFRREMSVQDLHALSHIDPWFLQAISELVAAEQHWKTYGFASMQAKDWESVKYQGFSDKRLSTLWECSESKIREARIQQGVVIAYQRIDTCAGEFATETAYMVGNYGQACESRPTDNKKMMVLGGGPNRIGQGIEFDYCCVHAVMAFKELGYETIMVNCNPETVSTDCHVADRLYFEPLTMERILAIVALEKPEGVVVQYGGQTPLKLASELAEAGVPILGTQPEAIARAEDREQFQKLVESLSLKQSPGGIVRSIEEGMRLAPVLSYPLMVRPSFVLGGRSMAVMHHAQEFRQYLLTVEGVSAKAPLLLDQFLDQAIEVDVDVVCDGQNSIVVGMMEHIEQAGVHSGDSACCLPPHSLNQTVQKAMAKQAKMLASALNVVGLMNVQFALCGDDIYVLEANPRASRTVPFVAKAIGKPVTKIAAKCMVGETLKSQGVDSIESHDYFAVKQPIFPFEKFDKVDPILGPEMRSTGESMGIDKHFGGAYLKSYWGVGKTLPSKGCIFISVRDVDKLGIIDVAQNLLSMGFSIVSTEGTHRAIKEAGLDCQLVNKVPQGRPNIVDKIKNDEIVFIINTTQGMQAIADSYSIRTSALAKGLGIVTTLAAAKAVCEALQSTEHSNPVALQDIF